MITFILSLAALVLGYIFYGRFVERVFGPESHPDFCGNPDTGEYTGDNSKSPAEPKRSITAEQFEHRMILRRAMLAHGFKLF